MTTLLSPILAKIGASHVSFWCPGCEDLHSIPVSGPGAWGYNDNPASPTFTPSILLRSGHYATGFKQGDECWCTWEAEGEDNAQFACQICHSFVTDGRIQFLNDCTHALAGRTVDLPNYPVNKEGDVE